MSSQQPVLIPYAMSDADMKLQQGLLKSQYKAGIDGLQSVNVGNPGYGTFAGVGNGLAAIGQAFANRRVRREREALAAKYNDQMGALAGEMQRQREALYSNRMQALVNSGYTPQEAALMASDDSLFQTAGKTLEGFGANRMKQGLASQDYQSVGLSPDLAQALGSQYITGDVANALQTLGAGDIMQRQVLPRMGIQDINQLNSGQLTPAQQTLAGLYKFPVKDAVDFQDRANASLGTKADTVVKVNTAKYDDANRKADLTAKQLANYSTQMDNYIKDLEAQAKPELLKAQIAKNQLSADQALDAMERPRRLRAMMEEAQKNNYFSDPAKLTTFHIQWVQNGGKPFLQNIKTMINPKAGTEVDPGLIFKPPDKK